MQNIENVFQPIPMATKIADMRRGADWFFWVAALGILNSLIVTFGGLPSMLFGLGSTQLVDEMLRVNSLAAVNPIGLFFNAAIAVLFAAFGYYARRGSDRIFVLGMFLYVVDAMIAIGFRDMWGFGFHLVALFYMGRGLLASRKRFDPSV
ncbi:MAG: hypothetical protein KF685_03885 [Acidobacteria bacterium]|nr:hypothetical protein [Acidobacteriota bacterium]